MGWADVSSFVNGADADLVVGQPDFFTRQQACFTDGSRFCGPIALAVDRSGSLFVSGHHINQFSAPFSQSSPVSGTMFENDVDLDPWGVAADSQGNIYVAFRNNNEVVEYDAGSTTPHLVFGQTTSSGGSCNEHNPSPSRTTLCSPYAVAVDAADNLYVADTSNNRVLVFHTPLDPLSGESGAGDTTADLVIGQSSFSTMSPGVSSTALSSPQGLTVDSRGNLYVADAANNRVTEYDAPLSSGKAASLVVGQPNATSNQCNRGGAVGAGTLCNPTGVSTDASDDLYVYDANNHRIAAYVENNPPRNAAATRVLGQHDLAHSTKNFVDAATVNAVAVAIDRGSTPNHLYAVDLANSRVLGYRDAAEFQDGGAADLVLGQPDFFTATANTGVPCCGATNARVLSLSLDTSVRAGAAVDSQGNLWVADPGNRRAVGYPAPFESGLTANQAATRVLGEPDLNTAGVGANCAATQSNTCAPRGLAFDASDNLYLVDSENQRILRFETPSSLPARTQSGPSGCSDRVTPGRISRVRAAIEAGRAQTLSACRQALR